MDVTFLCDPSTCQAVHCYPIDDKCNTSVSVNMEHYDGFSKLVYQLIISINNCMLIIDYLSFICTPGKSSICIVLLVLLHLERDKYCRKDISLHKSTQSCVLLRHCRFYVFNDISKATLTVRALYLLQTEELWV